MRSGRDSDTMGFSLGIGIAMLDEQYKSVETMLLRANILIGLNAILLGVLISTLRPDTIDLRILVFFISMMALLRALLLALFVSRQEEYRYIIHPRDLWELTWRDLSGLQTQLFVNVVRSYEHNLLSIGKKNAMINAAYSYLVVGILTMVLYSGVIMVW